MGLLSALMLAVSYAVADTPESGCWTDHGSSRGTVAGEITQRGPQRAADAIDVILTAKAAVAWDVGSHTVLYEKHAHEHREVASLSKLLSVLVLREHLSPDQVVKIPGAARRAQQLGAHISLPVGEQAVVHDLLAASLIASANDAVVTLAAAAAGDEQHFVELANEASLRLGLHDTRLANATGLPGGEQYSTAADVRRLLTLVYADPLLGGYLDDPAGTLVTLQGQRREYKSTNELLSTYLPILAAKTGYTMEAGENVALLTRTRSGQTIGIVILGSTARFQDAKILAEWINEHYTWP